MKKYILLGVVCIVAVLFCQWIPAINEQFAEPCVTIPIINDQAKQSIPCKGVIEQLGKNNYCALLQIGEDDISQVSVGQEVELHCAALGDTVLSGHLESLSDSAYQTNYGGLKIVVVDAVVSIDTPDKRLKSGYTVTADILITKLENANILPFEAVAKDKKGDYYIYRVENEYAVKEYVTVGFEDEKGIVVYNWNDDWILCENPSEYSEEKVRIKYVGND